MTLTTEMTFFAVRGKRYVEYNFYALHPILIRLRKTVRIAKTGGQPTADFSEGKVLDSVLLQ